MSSRDRDAQIDDELRNVSLPEGLLERLRGVVCADIAPDHSPLGHDAAGASPADLLQSDAGLDAALRAVPIPPHLLGHLRQVILVTDDGLDATLRDVPVPPRLGDQLRTAPHDVDPTLLRIRSTADPLARFRRRRRHVLVGRLKRWRISATLTVSLLGLLAFFLLAVHHPQEVLGPPPGMVVSDRTTLPPKPSDSLVFSEEPPGSTMLVAGADGAVLGAGADDTMLGAEADGAPSLLERVGLVNFGEPTTPNLLDSAIPHGAGFAPLVSTHDWGAKVLASHDLYDQLPELKKVSGLIPRGIDPPMVPGFDWPFYVRYGVFPFVSPADDDELRSQMVPLRGDTSSYALTQRYLEDDELPAAKDVRTEEFLAAIDYRFPHPQKSPLRLTLFGGPSPFAAEGTMLLQVAVQAKDFVGRSHGPIHLIACVDVSASMRWGGRLAMVRQALKTLKQQLGPDDHVSLVAFGESADLIVENVGADEGDQFIAALDSLAIEGSTNLGAGLQRAYATAERAVTSGGSPVHIVLLTDGLTELGRGATDQIEQRLAEATQQDIVLTVVDLSQEQEPNRQLASFAQSGGGKVYRATDAKEIGWALSEVLTGQPQLVAENARLKITFNPKTVLAYRRLGGEAKSLVGTVPTDMATDFHAGQSGTALFEIRFCFKPEHEVAKVELSWQDSSTEGKDRPIRVKKIERKHFAETFAKSASSLQSACLVAETAEVLRQSPFAPLGRGSRAIILTRVLDLADVASTELRNEPLFAAFLDLVDKARKARPHRSGERIH